MRLDVADGVRAANADARIDALVLHAGERRVAIGVLFAFASAAARVVEGVAFVAGQTEAGAGTVRFAALGVGAARRGRAGLVLGNRSWRIVVVRFS